MSGNQRCDSARGSAASKWFFTESDERISTGTPRCI
jgi:hypothetical protein